MRWTETRIGFSLPQVFHDTDVDLAAVRNVAVRTEAAGLDSLWTQAQAVGKAKVLDPLNLLCYVAPLTSRVKLGTSVLVVTEHTPVELAKQISTIDNLCGGRLLVGLGLGSPMLRLDGDRPVRRLLEMIEIMSALWSHDGATFDGEIWQIKDLDMNPKPVQRPRPPLWLGGRVPQALHRAVRLGDGWMSPGGSSTAEFAQYVAQLREVIAEEGRDPGSFTIAKRIYVIVDENRTRAEQRILERFTVYSKKPHQATSACLYGSPEQVAEGIHEVIDLGAELVVLNPLYDFEEQQDRLFDIVGV